MNEQRTPDLVQAWRESEDPIETFLEKRYLDLHGGDPGSPEEKRAVIRRRLEAWKRNIRRVEACAAEVPEDPALKEWQAAEMLDGVIRELEMDSAEEYRYLLNVFLLSGFRLAGQMLPAEGAPVRARLTEEYDLEWNRAEAASESERTGLYARTVRMMQCAGIAYHDATRQILAEIGAGREARFPERGPADRETLCLLSSFMASELVQEEASPEEQAILTEEAVPVCAAAEALIQEGRDPGTMENLTCGLLGAAHCGGVMPFLLLAAVYTAVQTVLTAVSLAAAGTAAALGISALRRAWKKVEATPHPEVLLPKNIFQDRPALNAAEAGETAKAAAREAERNWNDIYE